MKTLLDELDTIARRCEQGAEAFAEPQLSRQLNALREACERIERSWSGSWIGYHANVYLAEFADREVKHRFDRNRGLEPRPLSATRGPWREYMPEDVVSAIQARAKVPSMAEVNAAVEKARGTLRQCKEQLDPIIGALAHEFSGDVLPALRAELAEELTISVRNYITARRPTLHPTSDMRAVTEGITTPPHIAFEAQLIEQWSVSSGLKKLASIARRAAKYASAVRAIQSAPRPDSRRILLGHGRSPVWQELAFFLSDRLGLPYDEFNREPSAGYSFKERLLAMLDACSFAILILTGEDEHVDGTAHPRLNVVHELGLSQARYGFERAIVLLEEGCAEISNMHGVVHIRFPKGKILTCAEELRAVLEREGLIVPTTSARTEDAPRPPTRRSQPGSRQRRSRKSE